MAHAKQILVQYSTHKGSVRFDAKSKDKHPLFQNMYMMREGAAKLLGIKGDKGLDKAKAIEITVRIVDTQDDGEDEEEEEEDD